MGEIIVFFQDFFRGCEIDAKMLALKTGPSKLEEKQGRPRRVIITEWFDFRSPLVKCLVDESHRVQELEGLVGAVRDALVHLGELDTNARLAVVLDIL